MRLRSEMKLGKAPRWLDNWENLGLWRLSPQRKRGSLLTLRAGLFLVSNWASRLHEFSQVSAKRCFAPNLSSLKQGIALRCGLSPTIFILIESTDVVIGLRFTELLGEFLATRLDHGPGGGGQPSFSGGPNETGISRVRPVPTPGRGTLGHGGKGVEPANAAATAAADTAAGVKPRRAAAEPGSWATAHSAADITPSGPADCAGLAS